MCHQRILPCTNGKECQNPDRVITKDGLFSKVVNFKSDELKPCNDKQCKEIKWDEWPKQWRAKWAEYCPHCKSRGFEDEPPVGKPKKQE